jgi:molybdopterin molybdotransferase
MGEFDLVPEILAAAGVTIHFRKIRVRPGRPVLFGTRDETLVFGLPGNPISTLYAFDQYVLPTIRVFRRHPQPLVPICNGRLTTDLRTPEKWLTFVACRSEWEDGEYRLTPHATHGSADIFAITGADAVAMIPVGTREVAAGEEVRFRKLYQP